jgi:SagB-type dehydrogenase family enzyme
MTNDLTPSVTLPAPQCEGRCSVESALATRRSVRGFKDEPMSLAILSQLLWAAQGVTLKMDAPEGWSGGIWQGGKRTAPSAGAIYPLEVYVVAGNVVDLKPGVYKYRPLEHELLSVSTGDRRAQMVTRGPGQKWIEEAPCLLVVAAINARLIGKFGERAARYAHFEVGHAVENVCLQAVALGLGSTMVGAFMDEAVKEIVGMTGGEQPLAIVPVGKAR